MKRFVSNHNGVAMGDFTALILAGVAKIYAGEIVEEAKAIMSLKGESGPVKTHHLKLAKRELERQGKLDFYNIKLDKLLG